MGDRGDRSRVVPQFGRFIVLVLTVTVTMGVAPPPDDDPEIPAPGVIATFSKQGSDEPTAVRVVDDLAARWDLGSPDARVPSDGFVGRFRGMILIQSPGAHRFFARTDGSITLSLAGRVVLSTDGPGAEGHSSSIELGAGFTPIVLEYRHSKGEAHVAIDWEGPGFAREPLPARLLFHERNASPGPDRFEDGRRQADRLGCANCHSLLDLPRHPHLGPPLTDAGRAIDPGWLDAWLNDPSKLRPRSRMPAFGHGLNPEEVADLAAFLARVAPRPKEAKDETRMALNVANPDRGRLLFRSVGCLGCHTRGDVATPDGDRAAPDLADLGGKRSSTWIAEYLHHPKKGAASQHRADLRLSADEAAHLAAYLVTDPPGIPADRDRPRGNAARGRDLALRFRCAACHEIPGLDPPPADRPLTAGSRPDAGCLSDDAHPAPAPVPRYDLTDDQRQALRGLVARLPRNPSATGAETLAGDTMRRLNCLGCHIRDGQGASTLGPQVAAYLAGDSDLGGLKGTLTPPNLSAVGDKLRPDYLDESVRGKAPTARPWLSVRMPTFTFEPGEARALVAYLQGRDRMAPAADVPAQPTRPDAATFETAVALIGQRGFGCVNCHVLAGKIPPGGEPETLGPDLALAHRRMTERYFDRWISNPQRIIPGTPMPQFLQPVATVAGSFDRQLATIWQLLGSTRVAEAAAQGTREIVKRQGDRPLIVRDMVLLPHAPDTEYTPRGVAIGLKNDHSLLFDTGGLTWLACWHRGFLSRTKSGRLWEWHPEGEPLWVAGRRQPPIVFLDKDGKVILPAKNRERFGHFSELDFDGPDVRLSYTLNAPESRGGRPVEVNETIRPTAEGWERAIEVLRDSLPDDLRPALVVQVPSTDADREASTFTWKSGSDRVNLRVLGADPESATLPDDPSAHLFLPEEGKVVARIQLSVHPRK